MPSPAVPAYGRNPSSHVSTSKSSVSTARLLLRWPAFDAGLVVGVRVGPVLQELLLQLLSQSEVIFIFSENIDLNM
jgi:hypothetical protein